MFTEKMGEITLAIETAIQGGSLSIFQNGKEIDNWIGQTKMPKAEEILEQIQILLDKNQINKKLIELITVSNGPGSLTGIKIGLSVAKGLCRGFECRLIDQSILDCLTVMANPKIGGKILTAVPVGKNLIAWKMFEYQSLKDENIENAFQRCEFEAFVLEILQNEYSQIIVHEQIYELLEQNRKLPFDKIVLNAGNNTATYLNKYQYKFLKTASDNEENI